MTTLKYLMDREQNLVERIENEFDKHVRMSYELDENFRLTSDERKELEQKVIDSQSYEKALRTELSQVRKSMKRYFLKLLEN